MFSWWPQEEDLHLENVYYSEMKDAGFFDGDWEWYGFFRIKIWSCDHTL